MTKRISLRGAKIVLPSVVFPIIHIAARELSRYLFQVSRVVSPIVERTPSSGVSITLKTNQAEVPQYFNNTSDQSFELKVGGRMITITGTTPLGTLYGVYALLEKIGIGFYLGGDTFPEGVVDPTLPDNFKVKATPCFAVRGSNLHGNFLSGTAGWGGDDWRFYLDQMARMRCNLFMLHSYDHEPYAGYEINGEIFTQGPPPSSMMPVFGVKPMPTAQFSFGTGDYFDQEVFGPPPIEITKEKISQILGMQEILREAIRYGRQRGVLAAVGFEIPSGIPTDEKVREAFKERIRQFVQRYPDLAYFCLWQPEGSGLLGKDIPPDSAVSKLIAKYRKFFAYLGGERRIYAGIHLAEFARLAYQVLQKETSHIRLVVCGWGGDRWMRFGDYVPALHSLLPEDVILTCHDDTFIDIEPKISEVWGQLPSSRQRWGQPWIEADFEEMWTRQAKVEPLAAILPDMLAKGCQGCLALHWRGRDFEEEVGYLARFSWQPGLSANEYYRDCAFRMFGSSQERIMARLLGGLQKLGGRWTGIKGGLECAPSFIWTGHKPHWPYELDKYAVVLIRKAAEKVRDLFPDGGVKKITPVDLHINRFRQMEKIEPKQIRQELIQIEEELFQIRTGLSKGDTTLKTWMVIDSLILPLHHLNTRANHTERTKQLLEIRENLLNLRRAKRLAGGNLERFVFLLNTIDVVLSLDRVSITLAEPGPVADLLSLAQQSYDKGDLAKATNYAVSAYQLITNSGVQNMLESQVGKLTTQCEWAVLALMNTKALPVYWDILRKAESFLPAVPPRELVLRLQKNMVLIQWESTASAKGYNLYRRKVGEKNFQRVNTHPLFPKVMDIRVGDVDLLCTFVDRPKVPGTYEYAVAAIGENGWESPISHTRKVIFKIPLPAPRIFGILQGFCLRSGSPHEVRVVVPPDDGDEVASVTLRYRRAGEKEWCETPMVRRFRYGYHGILPVFTAEDVVVEYYAEVKTVTGQKSTWPVSIPQKTFPKRYWTATIIP